MKRISIAVILVASSCAAGTDRASTTTTTESIQAGYVVWVSADGVFSHTMATGDTARLGPDGDAFPTQPTPGPGGQLAWSELTATEGLIAIADEAGNVQRVEAPTSPFYYSWSPDGQLLAFLGSGASSLIFGVVENGVARSVDTGAPYYFDWSRDSRSLFVHRVGTDLGLLTLDGERVVIDASPATFQAPQWTNEGVVYAVTGAGTFAKARSAAGVLLATPDQPADLVVATAPGEDPTVITTLSAFSSFDRAGDRVAVLSFTAPPVGSLRIVDVATGATTEIAGAVLAHRWSPDGTKLLILRSDDQGSAVWEVWEDDTSSPLVTFVPTTSFVRDYLPFWDQYSRSLTLWSPRSDAFTFAGRVDGEDAAGVYVQYLDGRRERLGDGNFSAWGVGGS